MSAFQFTLDKDLRKLGLEGKLGWAMMHEGALQLQDDTGHVVRLLPAGLVKLRLGYVDAKRRAYHMYIWRDTFEDSIELVPVIQTWAGYRETAIALVQSMHDAGRLDRIETGSSKFDALLGPALMLIPAGGALFLALFVLTEEPWWGRVIMTIAPLLLLAVLIWVGKNRYWPRQVREISDVNRHLPPS